MLHCNIIVVGGVEGGHLLAPDATYYSAVPVGDLRIPPLWGGVGGIVGVPVARRKIFGIVERGFYVR